MLNKYWQALEEVSLNIPGLVYFGHKISTKADLPMAYHTHEGCIEIVAVIKGIESYYVENRKFDLSGGDVFVSFVDQPHRSGNSSQGICEILWFIINTSVKQNFLGLSNPYGELLRSKISSIDRHVMKTDKEGISYLKKSFEGFLKQNPESRLYAQSHLVSFLSQLLFVPDQTKRDDEMMENIRRYIDRNIYEDIRLEDICSTFGLSLSSLKHKFKEYTGVTPRDFINCRKVEIAKELLKKGKSVTGTAMQLSFNSSDYFSVVFKKYTACSPTAYSNSLSGIKQEDS